MLLDGRQAPCQTHRKSIPKLSPSLSSLGSNTCYTWLQMNESSSDTGHFLSRRLLLGILNQQQEQQQRPTAPSVPAPVLSLLHVCPHLTPLPEALGESCIILTHSRGIQGGQGHEPPRDRLSEDTVSPEMVLLTILTRLFSSNVQ